MLETVQTTNIHGVLIDNRKCYTDSRGSFKELTRPIEVADHSDNLNLQPRILILDERNPQSISAIDTLNQSAIISVVRGSGKIILHDNRTNSATHGEVVTINCDSDMPEIDQGRFAIIIPQGVQGIIVNDSVDKIFSLLHATSTLARTTLHATLSPHMQEALPNHAQYLLSTYDRNALELTLTHTSISDVFQIDGNVLEDNGGSIQLLQDLDHVEQVLGRQTRIAQMSISRNERRVVRGLHAEIGQDKTIMPLFGKVKTFWVDGRPSSATYRQVVEWEMGTDTPHQRRRVAFVGEGNGNSFAVLGDQPVIYAYAISDVYRPDRPKRQFQIADPQLGIQLPYPWKEALLSDADKANHSVTDPSVQAMYA